MLTFFATLNYETMGKFMTYQNLREMLTASTFTGISLQLFIRLITLMGISHQQPYIKMFTIISSASGDKQKKSKFLLCIYMLFLYIHIHVV